MVHKLAVSNLLVGNIVVVDAVDPVPEARSSWREAASRAGAALLHLEVVLPDEAEHRRRVTTSRADLPGHQVPTWAEVQRGRWTAWDEDRDGPRFLVDATDLACAVGRVLDAIAAKAGP